MGPVTNRHLEALISALGLITAFGPIYIATLVQYLTAFPSETSTSVWPLVAACGAFFLGAWYLHMVRPDSMSGVLVILTCQVSMIAVWTTYPYVQEFSIYKFLALAVFYYIIFHLAFYALLRRMTPQGQFDGYGEFVVRILALVGGISRAIVDFCCCMPVPSGTAEFPPTEPLLNPASEGNSQTLTMSSPAHSIVDFDNHSPIGDSMEAIETV